MAGSRPESGCLGYTSFVLALLWITAVTLALQAGGWLTEQFTLVFGDDAPGYAWAAFSWVNAVAVWLATLPLLALTRSRRLRSVYVIWALAGLFLCTLSVARLVPTTSVQLAAVIQIVVGALAALSLLLLIRRRGLRMVWTKSIPSAALSAAPVAALPWVLFGALGSPLDTLLHLLSALTIGLFAGLLLDGWLLFPTAVNTSRSRVDMAFTAFGSVATLALLGAGFGSGGSQLLLMAALPPLGIGVAAIRSRRAAVREDMTSWLSIALLVGLVAAGPLAFFDPDELTLLLGDEDIPGWASTAALLSLASGAVASLAVWLMTARQNWMTGRRGRLLLPVSSWAVAALAYLMAGQPGFHGERLFVIMRDQADLSQAYSIADREERVRYVYSTLVSHAEATQAELRSDLDRFGVAYRPYYLVNGLEIDGGPLARQYLATRPEVDRVLESPRLRPLPQSVSPPTGDSSRPDEPVWNVAAIGADRAWSELGVTGRGIVVGIMDSGVQGDHPSLAAGYRGRADGDDYHWLDPWYQSPQPVDLSGHGTHTTGTVLGRGGIGVAPDAEWFACVNLARNLGNAAYYLECMQFVLAPYPQSGDPFADGDSSLAAHVTNNSWGCPPIEGCDATALLQAAAAFRAAGIFTVVSAGNTGPECESVSDPPAIYREVLTIGAVDEAGVITEFSSRGPVIVGGGEWMKPDLVAPGEDILSSFPNGSYRRESGTSMAGPHVAGVVALMWSAQPRLIGDIQRTEELLIETAQDREGEGNGCLSGGVPNTAYGYGVVDAYAAVRAAMEME